MADGTLYLWPCPSAAAAESYSIHYTYVRFLEVQTASNETLDFPQQWIEAVTWNLARKLMTQYPVNDPNLMQIVMGTAKETMAALRSWDNEPASIHLQPDYLGQAYG